MMTFSQWLGRNWNQNKVIVGIFCVVVFGILGSVIISDLMKCTAPWYFTFIGQLILMIFGGILFMCFGE